MSKNKSKNNKRNNNTAYIFIPFIFERKFGLHSLNVLNRKKIAELSDEEWELVRRKGNNQEDDLAETKYLLRFFTDKMNPNKKDCLCYHYTLKQNHELFTDYIAVNDHSDHKEVLGFNLQKVHLYMFQSEMGIMAFQIHFEETDAKKIAAAEYYLKKVGRNNIRYKDIQSKNGKSELTNFLAFANQLAADTLKQYYVNFFNFITYDEERANIFTHIEVEDKTDTDEICKEEIFFLRNCYNDGFIYSERIEDENGNGIFWSSQDVIWGVSEEALTCRVRLNDNNRSFRQNKYSDNIHSAYLFMYVMLLHQKYMLYQIMVKIGNEESNSEYKISKHKDILGKFATNYKFSLVTEVPQYQKLYDRIYQEFRIESIYQELLEPVERMAQSRQEKRESGNNTTLFILAALGLFSAMIDFSSLVEVMAGWDLVMFAPLKAALNELDLLQYIGIAVILLAFMVSLLFSRIKAGLQKFSDYFKKRRRHL